MEPTLPVLPRIDRLDRLLLLLEEKHSKSTRSGSTTTNNADDYDNDHEEDNNHKEKANCKPLMSALDDVHHKGTLIDRLAILENRVLQLILDMEEGSTSRSSPSTANYPTREEKDQFPINDSSKKSLGKGKRRRNFKWMRWFYVRC